MSRKYARIITCDHCKKPIGPEELRGSIQAQLTFLDSCMLAARLDVCPACVKSKPLGILLKKRREERAEPNEALRKYTPKRPHKRRDVELKLLVGSAK